jgi:hypothetical protein
VEGESEGLQELGLELEAERYEETSSSNQLS